MREKLIDKEVRSLYVFNDEDEFEKIIKTPKMTCKDN